MPPSDSQTESSSIFELKREILTLQQEKQGHLEQEAALRAQLIEALPVILTLDPNS